MINLRAKRLAEILNNATLPQKRVVVYNAISTVLSNVVINHITTNEKTVEAFKGKMPLVVRKVVFLLNEIGVVDTTLAIKTLTNHIDFRTKTTMENDAIGGLLYNSNCFEDTLKITSYFSKETIDLINSEFKLFRQTMIDTNDLVEFFRDKLNNQD